LCRLFAPGWAYGRGAGHRSRSQAPQKGGNRTDQPRRATNGGCLCRPCRALDDRGGGNPALRAGLSKDGLSALPTLRFGRFGRAVSPGFDSPGQRPGNGPPNTNPPCKGGTIGPQQTVTPGARRDIPPRLGRVPAGPALTRMGLPADFLAAPFGHPGCRWPVPSP
jgi:hypothetical protein